MKTYNVILLGSQRESKVGEVRAENAEEALYEAEQVHADPDSGDMGFGSFRVEEVADETEAAIIHALNELDGVSDYTETGYAHYSSREDGFKNVVVIDREVYTSSQEEVAEANNNPAPTAHEGSMAWDEEVHVTVNGVKYAVVTV